MTLVSQNDLEWLAARLSIAVYDVNRITPEMSVLDLRSTLQGIEGSESLTVSYAKSGNQIIHLGDKELEVGPMASNAEIRAALLNPFVRTENTKMSISGYEPGAIKARLEALKKAGKDRRDQAIAKLDEAGKKHEAVSEEIERVAATIEKEADAALQEFAEFSNGGPA